MARTDFRTPRLYVEAALAEEGEVKLDPQQTNYLVNVLRLGAGSRVLLFNGRDGEFASALATPSRKGASLVVGSQTRPQESPPDVARIASCGDSGLPSFSVARRNSKNFPSGDQRGAES